MALDKQTAQQGRIDISIPSTPAADPEVSYAVRSLARGLTLLRCFTIDNPEWSLAELSKRTGLNKVTVFRLLKTLEQEGFLRFDATTSKYNLGSALHGMAYVLTSHSQLIKTARPHLERLAQATEETVDLAVPTSNGALFIAQILTSRPFKPASSVGRTFADCGNTHSKVFLAFSSRQKQLAALTRPHVALTPYTIVDHDKILAELDRVVAEGVAYDLQEQTLGICGVAAPVRDFSGKVIASLAIAVPEERFGPAETQKLTVQVSEAALALSQELGFRDIRLIHGESTRFLTDIEPTSSNE